MYMVVCNLCIPLRNAVTDLGGGDQGFFDDNTEASELKSVTKGRGLKVASFLDDPLKHVTWHNLCNNL